MQLTTKCIVCPCYSVLKIDGVRIKGSARCHYAAAGGVPLRDMLQCPRAAGAYTQTAAEEAPDRYTWRGKECREIQRIMATGCTPQESPLMYDTVKYLYRHPKKGKARDLLKAMECIGEMLQADYGVKVVTVKLSETLSTNHG